MSTPVEPIVMRRDVVEYECWRAMNAATSAEPRQLPRETGVYFVIETATKKCVYVGKACDLRQRWKGHKLRPLLSAGHELRWKPVDRSWFCNAEHEEAFFIAVLRPKYNRILKANVYA